MKKQRENSPTVRLVLWLGLLLATLLSCNQSDYRLLGPYLHIDSVTPISSSTGQPITVTVSVSGNRNKDLGTGTVYIQADTGCTATLENGTGSCQVSFNLGGNRVITADYSGDSHYGSERATYPYFVVAPLTPTPFTQTRITIISHSPDPSSPGESVEFKVRVNALPDVGTYPTGTVTIGSTGETGCTATLSNGEGKCSARFTTPGEKTITADYNGGGGWVGNQYSITHVVSYASQVTLSITPNPPVAGQPVLATVTVSVVNGGPTPTGIVNIEYGGGLSCPETQLVDGSVTCQFVFAEAGEQTIHAYYIPTDSEWQLTNIFRISEASLDVNVRPKIIVVLLRFVGEDGASYHAQP